MIWFWAFWLFAIAAMLSGCASYDHVTGVTCMSPWLIVCN